MKKSGLSALAILAMAVLAFVFAFSPGAFADTASLPVCTVGQSFYATVTRTFTIQTSGVVTVMRGSSATTLSWSVPPIVNPVVVYSHVVLTCQPSRTFCENDIINPMVVSSGVSVVGPTMVSTSTSSSSSSVTSSSMTSSTSSSSSATATTISTTSTCLPEGVEDDVPPIIANSWPNGQWKNGWANENDSVNSLQDANQIKLDDGVVVTNVKSSALISNVVSGKSGVLMVKFPFNVTATLQVQASNPPLAVYADGRLLSNWKYYPSNGTLIVRADPATFSVLYGTSGSSFVIDPLVGYSVLAVAATVTVGYVVYRRRAERG